MNCIIIAGIVCVCIVLILITGVRNWSNEYNDDKGFPYSRERHK